MRRLCPDPVQSDVVRARLATLAAELAPRYAGDPPAGAPRPLGLAGSEPLGPAASRRSESSGPPEPPDPHEPPDHLATPAPPDPGPPPRAASGAPGLLGRAWEFGRAHVAVVGVIGLVGLLAAVWSLTQARTVPIAVAHPVQVSATAVGSPTPEPTPEPLRVHVLGAVARPGVVMLTPGSRVEDAIAAAGGLTADARPGELNLAAVVADGAQVVIGTERDPGGEIRGTDHAGGGSPGGAGSAPGGQPPSGVGEQVDLNRATAVQLEQLPGIGPVTAAAIIAWREQHGRFTRPEELQEVDGIGPKTWQRLAPYVRV